MEPEKIQDDNMSEGEGRQMEKSLVQDEHYKAGFAAAEKINEEKLMESGKEDFRRIIPLLKKIGDGALETILNDLEEYLDGKKGNILSYTNGGWSDTIRGMHPDGCIDYIRQRYARNLPQNIVDYLTWLRNDIEIKHREAHEKEAAEKKEKN